MDTNKSNLKKQHRDTFFRWFFKQVEHFLQLLHHCSAGGTLLTIDDIEPFDLDSELAYRIRRNDVSFITKDNRLIILIEHQTTINPNMAFRLFIYYIELLQLWIKQQDINIYGTKKLQNFPVPEIYVAYNGSENPKEEDSTFELEHEGVKIKITAKIIDIHCEKLENTSKENSLAGYAYFYSEYDKRVACGETRQTAFEAARQKCIKTGHLEGFIEKESFIMFYKDFMDYDKQLRYQIRAEGEAIGEAKGEAKGKVEGVEQTICAAIRNNAPYPIIEAMAKEVGISKERLENLMKLAQEPLPA